MTDTETIKIPYFLSNKILLFENIKNGYIVDFKKSVKGELDWLNTEKSTINELLNTTEFNIIQKQITENIESSEETITNNLKALTNNLKPSISNNSNNNIEIDLTYDAENGVFEKHPPSLSDFIKNPITESKEEIITLDNESPSKNNETNKLSPSKSSSTSNLNTIKNHSSIFNTSNLKEAMSIESMNSSIEDRISKNSKKPINNEENSLSEKESKFLDNSKTNEIVNSTEITKTNISNQHIFPHNMKDTFENNDLIINGIENQENFKKHDKSEHYSMEQKTPDVVTDFKRSLNNYTAHKKKSAIASMNDTIDSSTTLRNNTETLTLTPSTRMEDDTLGSTLNNNTVINIDTSSINMENKNKNKNKNPEVNDSIKRKRDLLTSLLEENNIDPEFLNIDLPNIKMEEETQEEKEKERRRSRIISSFLDEVDKDENNTSGIRIYGNSVIDEFKDFDTDMDILNSYDPTKVKVKEPDNNNFKSNNNNDDDLMETFFEESKNTEKKKKKVKTEKVEKAEKTEKVEKRSVTKTAFNILTSPFTPFSHSHSEKKSKFTTPDKKNNANNSEGSKKSVSERFKALWDSTTKGLHYAFSRNPSSSNSIFSSSEISPKKSITNTSLSPSVKLCNSPEHESSQLSFTNNNNNKSPNFKNDETDQNLKLKTLSSSVPSNNKTNLLTTKLDEFNNDFKEVNSISFATAIQSPPDSPLALKSTKKSEKKNNENNNLNILNDSIFKSIDNDLESISLFNTSTSSSPLLNKSLLNSNILKKSNSNNGYHETLSQSSSKYLNSINNNNNHNNDSNSIPMNIDDIGKENKLKKSVSDLTNNSSFHKEENKKDSSSVADSSRNIYGMNSNKDQSSFLPKNTKIKKTTVKKPTRDKLKSLDSSKLIKKHELALDKKQKIRMNAERHMLYLKKKREEEGKLTAEKQKAEEKRVQSEAINKMNKQKQLEVEILIKKRNEKIRQVNEKKKALRSREMAKSILLNNSNIYRSNSILDKIKTFPINTNTVLKKKNSNNNSIIKKPKISGIKNTSLISNNTIKSSIPKSKLIVGKSKPKSKSKLTNLSSISISNNNNNININSTISNSSNTSTQNILSSLHNNPPPSKPIIIGLNNLDEYSNKKVNTSIISISSSRSSTTSYKGTILQNGEFPDIPSDYSEEDSRASLVATWAKTPYLLKELEKQKDINPDDIFGGYKPCHLDEIFKGSHFKRHTSNENRADSSILHDDE